MIQRVLLSLLFEIKKGLSAPSVVIIQCDVRERFTSRRVLIRVTTQTLYSVVSFWQLNFIDRMNLNEISGSMW